MDKDKILENGFKDLQYAGYNRNDNEAIFDMFRINLEKGNGVPPKQIVVNAHELIQWDSKKEIFSKVYAASAEAAKGQDLLVTAATFNYSEKYDRYYLNKIEGALRSSDSSLVRSHVFTKNFDDGLTRNSIYNMLSGRFALLRFEVDGEKRSKWSGLNFNVQIGPNNNYEEKSYHEKYGYSVEAALKKHNIDDADPYLVKDLERGDLKAVNVIKDGQPHRFVVSAAPQYKTLDFYDLQLNRLEWNKDLGLPVAYQKNRVREAVNEGEQPSKEVKAQQDNSAPVVQQDRADSDKKISTRSERKRSGLKR